MPHTPVPVAGGAMPAGRLFIEVTPAMRRALELLADAAILVLDEIDGDVDAEPTANDDQDIVDEPHDDRECECLLASTEREDRTGKFGRGVDSDDEPMLGARENAWPTRIPGTLWTEHPTPLRLDELEDVCEDEGAQCEDEGFAGGWGDGGI